MKTTLVNMGELAISRDPDEVLATNALGSCLGVAIYDPIVRVGGLLHCMLPLSRIDPEKAAARPAMYVDTGVTAMLRKMFSLGVRKSNAIVKVAGGGRVLDAGRHFQIGQRNFIVLRRILWKNDMLIAAQDVGGEARRSMRMEIRNGNLTVKRVNAGIVFSPHRGGFKPL